MVDVGATVDCRPTVLRAPGAGALRPIRRVGFDLFKAGDGASVRTLSRMGAHLVVLSDQLWALLVALERYDGAVAAQDADAADTQADTVRRNADACAGTQDELAGLASDLNGIWTAIHDIDGFDWTAVSVDDARQFFTECWGDPPGAPGTPLEELMSCVTGAADDVLVPFPDTGLPDPILDMTGLPAEPASLFDDDFAGNLAELSETLRNLVTEPDA